jgi:hypothetical protein
MPTVVKKKKGGFPVGFVILLVVLIAVGGGAYYFWQQTQQKQRAAAEQRQAAVDQTQNELKKFDARRLAIGELTRSGKPGEAVAAYDKLADELRAAHLKDAGATNKLLVAIEADRDAAKAAQAKLLAAAAEAKKTKLDKPAGGVVYAPAAVATFAGTRTLSDKALPPLKPSHDPLYRGRAALRAGEYADAIAAVAAPMNATATPDLRLRATLIAAAAHLARGDFRSATRLLEQPWVRPVLRDAPELATPATLLTAISFSGDPDNWGRGLAALSEHVTLVVLKGSDPLAGDEAVDLLGTALNQWASGGKARSSKFDDWSRCYAQAVARLEAARPGEHKLGARWAPAADGAKSWLTATQITQIAIRCAGE